MATPSKYIAFQDRRDDKTESNGVYPSSLSHQNQFSNLEHYESSLNKRPDSAFESQQLYSHAINGSFVRESLGGEVPLQNQRQSRPRSIQRTSSVVSNQSKLYIERQRALRKLDAVLVNETTFGKLRYLLTNFEFMTVLFILTAVYFITTGMQFWMTDYWVHAIGESKSMATIYFSVAAITGPVSGVILGGYIFTKIGGFQSPKAFGVCTAVMCLGTLLGFPLPFIPITLVQVFLVWGQFFCGGFCLPALMSMQINNVPSSTKTTANSVANCVYNLLGYLPAPYIYGLVYDATGGADSRWGMVSLECAGVLANLIMLAVIFKERRDEAKIARSKDLTEPLTETKAVDLNELSKQKV